MKQNIEKLRKKYMYNAISYKEKKGNGTTPASLSFLHFIFCIYILLYINAV